MARIPLQPNLRPRDSDGEKDSRLVNGFVEKGAAGGARTVKRPGMLVEVMGAGVPGAGIFTYEDTVYVWDTSTPPREPAVVPFTDLSTRVVVSDVALSDDQYRFVTVYPDLFEAWTTGSYFFGTSIPLTAGTTIEEGTSSTSQPITVVGGSTFVYREKVNTGVTASGSGELIATLSSGNLFTLVNTIDLGSVTPWGLFANDTNLYVVVDNGTAHYRVGVVSDLDAGTISVDGSSNLDDYTNTYTFTDGTNHYTISSENGTVSYDNTPFTDWTNYLSTDLLSQYSAIAVDVYDTAAYSFRLQAMAYGLYKISLTTGDPSSVSTNLPTTGYGYVFAHSPHVYVYRVRTGGNPSELYRSSDTLSWTLFYTLSDSFSYFGAVHTSTDAYVMLSSDNIVPDTLLTVSATGCTEQATGITFEENTVAQRLFYVDGSVYHVELIRGSGVNKIKIWKKTG